MVELGVTVPDFKLPDVVSGNTVRLSDYKGKKAVLIIFICNHCPYVKLIKEALVTFANAYKDELQVVAINANDAEHHPHDSPEKMAEEAREFSYPFPYLYDESQDVAKAYEAACTPDLFLVDANRKLMYRWQFDDSRPANGQPVTGKDIRNAVDLLLEEGKMVENQKPSMGCSIKWKQGNEPKYFG